MTRVLITGGSGTLGSQVAKQLLAQGYTVRILSRSAKPTIPGVEWAQAELETGNGVTDALVGVDTLVHSASSPTKTAQVDVEGTKPLLDMAKQAGVNHFLYISIVGIDKIPLPYYTLKLETEKVVMNGGVPWSILRITQFHTLIDTMFGGLTKLPLIGLLPAHLKFQPIDPRDAAVGVCEVVKSGAVGRAPDIGGPEVLDTHQLIRQWLAARHMRKAMLPIPVPGKIAAGYRQGLNTIPTNRYGKITWGEWLKQTYAG